MVTGLLLEDNVVINTATFDSEEALFGGYILSPSEEVGIGDFTEDHGLTFIRPEPELPELSPEELEAQEKLEGIEFEGVMCSATKEDMWGLNSVSDYIERGNQVNFEFSNGSVLALTQFNLAQFWAVWTPFRLSFFKEQ